jgi:hypothetical protein
MIVDLCKMAGLTPKGCHGFWVNYAILSGLAFTISGENVVEAESTFRLGAKRFLARKIFQSWNS